MRGKDTLAGWRGDGGSIVRKTPDTALDAIYASTLCSLVCAYLKQITALLKVYSEDGETARAAAQAARGTLQALEGCPQVSEVFSRQAGPAKNQLDSFLVFLPVGCGNKL